MKHPVDIAVIENLIAALRQRTAKKTTKQSGLTSTVQTVTFGGTRMKMNLIIPKTASLEPSIGGLPSITKEDILAVLGFCSKPVSDYALYKFAHDERLFETCVKNLTNEIAAMTVNWRSNSYVIEDSIVRLSILEHAHPHLCGHCKGAGVHKNQKPCQKCGGTGKINIKASQRARAIGMDRRKWKATWSGRYEQVYSVVNEWENCLYKALKKI